MYCIFYGFKTFFLKIIFYTYNGKFLEYSVYILAQKILKNITILEVSYIRVFKLFTKYRGAVTLSSVMLQHSKEIYLNELYTI